MGFGEAFQGMTDREILVEVATKIVANDKATKESFKMLNEKVSAIEEKVDNIKCPSPKCADHEKRISEQERVEKERAEKTVGRRELILWAVGIVVMTIASNFALILSLRGT